MDTSEKQISNQRNTEHLTSGYRGAGLRALVSGAAPLVAFGSLWGLTLKNSKGSDLRGDVNFSSNEVLLLLEGKR